MKGIIWMMVVATSLLGNDHLAQADALYRQRAEGAQGGIGKVEKIKASIEQYERALKNTPSLEARWKLMRALYFYGRYTGQSREAQQNIFSRMITLGERGLVKLGISAKDDPEKIAEVIKNDRNKKALVFWQAVAWGQWSLAYGKMKAVRKGAAGKIRNLAKGVYLIDPDFEQAGALRVMGRLYHQTPRVPFITGWASNKKALKFLKEAYKRAPDNFLNKLFLAELLLDEGEKEEARKLLMELVKATPHEDHFVEDLDAQKQAKARLGQ